MAKERVKRGAGRPRAVARAIDPDEIQRIADWRLQGCSLSEIALRLGVHRSTVQHHLKAIGHEWQVGHNVDRAEQLAKVNLMERVAWERFEQSMKPQTRKQLKFDLAKDLKAKNVDAAEARRLVEEVVTRTTRTGEPAWLGVIQWCAEYRAKVFGWYASQKQEVEHREGYRVAGLSGDEARDRVAKKIRELLLQQHEGDVPPND